MAHTTDRTALIRSDRTDAAPSPVTVGGAGRVTPYFPAYPSGQSSIGTVPAKELNRRSRASVASRVQVTTGGVNSLIKILYGKVRIGGTIYTSANYLGNYVVAVVWGWGECDAVESVTINNKALPSGVSVTHYLGTSTQTVDSTLAAAISGYNDALLNVCYSVFVIQPRVTTGYPTFEAVVRGRKIRSTQYGARAYSNDPALIIADFIEDSTFGMSGAVDWGTVAACYSDNQTMLGGAPKRSLNIALAESMLGEDWLRTLRDYADIFIVPEGATFRFVLDGTGSSVYSFTTANIVRRSLRLFKRKGRQQPNMVRVYYTDTSQVPYKEATYTTPAVSPRRLSPVRIPGITNYAEAARYATERLNGYKLRDLNVSFDTFDAGLKIQVGDLIDITHPVGLSAKLFRVAFIGIRKPGRWTINAVEYDPAVYDNSVATGPTFPDTSLLGPLDYPTVAPSAAETVSQNESGLFTTQAVVSWSAVTNWPFLKEFRVDVRSGASVIHTGTAKRETTSYTTPPLVEGAYNIDVYPVSTFDGSGAPGTCAVTLLGKSAIPGDVSTIFGFEAGGRVFLQWSRADLPGYPGTPDPDIWRYEVRRGQTTDAWSAATLVDQVDALTLVVETLPPGTWRFFVKAIDSVKQYSTNAVTVDVVVTLDAGAYSAQTNTYAGCTLTNMTAWTARPDPTPRWTSDFGDGIGYGADNTNNAVGTFNDSLASTVWPQPHTAGNSAWESASWDLGLSMSGTWLAETDYTLHAGTATVSIKLSTDNTNWTTYPGSSVKAAGRYARIRIDFTTGSGTVNGYPTLSLAQAPRSETVASVTTLASGGKLVELAGAYNSVRTIQLTPLGSTFATAVADRILVAPVDGLMMHTEHTSTTNPFTYFRFSAASRVIQTGDYLEYDVWVSPANASTSQCGAMDVLFSDATTGLVCGVVDQDGVPCRTWGPSANKGLGAWYHRKMSLSACVGKTSAQWWVVTESDNIGSFDAIYADIKITDGAGTTRLQLYSSGEPSDNAIYTANNYQNAKLGPANSFMAYAFNSAGTQIAKEVTVKFEGS